MERCRAFDQQLMADAEKAGGRKYAELLALTYRHSITAHKLLTDKEGNLLFLSKENHSNGCINTVDLTYPSAPLYLIYNAYRRSRKHDSGNYSHLYDGRQC